MSYVNYAATNQIPVSLCIFIDVIIIEIVNQLCFFIALYGRAG